MTKHSLAIAVALLLNAALAASAAPRHAPPVKRSRPAASTPTPAPAPQSPGGFRDVPPDHWAARAVETLRRAGIVRGYPGGTNRTGR